MRSPGESLSRHIAIAVLLPCIAVLGCGDDPAAPDAGMLQGTWTYSARSLTGVLPERPDLFPGIRKVSATCFVSATSLSLTHSSATLSGSYSEAVLSCDLLSEATFGNRQVFTEVIGPSSGPIGSSSTDGTQVSLRFETSVPEVFEWVSDGEADGDSASGDVTIDVILDEAPVTLRGQWTAARTP